MNGDQHWMVRILRHHFTLDIEHRMIVNGGTHGFTTMRFPSSDVFWFLLQSDAWISTPDARASISFQHYAAWQLAKALYLDGIIYWGYITLDHSAYRFAPPWLLTKKAWAIFYRLLV